MMHDTHRTLFTTVPLHRHFLTKPPGKRFSLTHTRKYSNWVACGLPDQPDHTNLKSATICKSKGQLCFCLHLRNKWLWHWRLIKSWQPSSLVLVVWCESSCSLLPRPSYHPIFDYLHYAQTRGDDLVHFIMWIHAYLCRQRWRRGFHLKYALSPLIYLPM